MTTPLTHPFTHLHTHSHYSLLDGLSKIEDLVAKAKADGQSALAITDHGNLYGAIEFYIACKKAGIKPIIGIEAYVANRTRFDKEPNIDNKRYHLILLAKNLTGYRNLLKLVSLSHIEGMYYKPRVDKELLADYSEGLICLSGCFGGELARALRNRDRERALAVIAEHQAIFGRGNYFLEIQNHPNIDGHEEVVKEIIALGHQLKIPIVATGDSHYTHHDDKKAHETLLSVQSHNDSREKKFSFGVDDFSFATTAEMYERFSYIPEAIENTTKVAAMCDFELTLGKFTFPKFVLAEGETEDGRIRELAIQGIERRGLLGKTDVLERLDYELGIIAGKGYASYFLVVEDLVRFAAEHGILTNIRGSVAGSMTTYLLGITKINPLEYNIPFERFLNPERPSAPDIDMDFADNRRDEVIEYARQKYGKDNVAQIGTFGTMMAKGSIRDVARALGHPYNVGDRLSKMIPLGSQGFPMTIDHAMELEPELKKAYESEPESREILDIAKKLEGCVRHISVHAAGVVVSPTPLSDWTPIQHDPKGGKLITQYDMYSVGEDGVGLTKFDFLGIRNLAILSEAVTLVERYHALHIDIDTIPLDDKKTFEMLARGETEGLFQLNGDGMTKWLVELKPTTIHDINAMVALYRPGPMQFIPDYIKHKHSPSVISYLDPRMKDILSQSYGVVTYQDDVLMIANLLGGYTWLETDKLRKAMGKKIPKEMEAQKEKLTKGFIANGLVKEKAEELWKLIEPFAAYGFNKAHAASYGLLAYQTAYMKANFPAEYMAAIMSAEAGDVEKIAVIISESVRMGIPVLPPDVNESQGDFAVMKGSFSPLSRPLGRVGGGGVDRIRFGLHSVKNLGNEIADAIITEREKGGRYASFADFLERVRHKNLTKKSLEALVMCGAMDALGERGVLMANIEEALEYNRGVVKDAGNAQASLFGLMASTASVPAFKLKDAPRAEQKQKLAWEKELLGLYVSGHPLDRVKDKLEKREWDIKKIKERLKDGMECVPVGIVESVRDILTKKNERMAFVKISDYTDSIEVVFFPRVFEAQKNLLAPDKILAIKGKFSKRNGEPSILADAVKEVD